jgi:NADH-quinone oxidoreductase subunit F
MKDLLENIRQTYEEKYKNVTKRVLICAGTGCIANGSLKIYDEFVKKIKDKNLNVVVDLKAEEIPENSTLITESGCQGFCQMGTLVMIQPENILYVKVKPQNIDEIIETTIIDNQVVERFLFKNNYDKKTCKNIKNIEFYKKQHKIVLEKCGYIDPNDINEYIYTGGYSAAKKAYLSMSPEKICNKIADTHLRDKAAKALIIGKKWDFVRIQNSEKKYIICNGNQGGDQGAFVDRNIIEGNPHLIIEGMMIAAKAIGSDEGFIHVDLTYPSAPKRINQAIKEAEEIGILGKNIFGSGYNFSIHVVENTGSFVCNEETALILSLEGLRAIPRPKPPYITQSGLWEKPTVVDDIETLAKIPFIINHETNEFIKIGTRNSAGTKVFSLAGHIAYTGLIEVPFGITLEEIIFNIGGGVLDDNGNIYHGFKAIQVGGPSGNCLTKQHLHMSLDFDSLKNIGATIGSGGLVVINKDTCIVQIALYFMKFLQNESCGKCVLCREGTRQMLSILNDIVEGTATSDALDLIEQLALAVQKGSLCDFGKTAPNSILSTLKYFKEEYESHVTDKKCPTKKCKSLVFPTIIKERCTGCSECIEKCPTNAIIGNKTEPRHIDERLCNKCLTCIYICEFKAIEVGA